MSTNVEEIDQLLAIETATADGEAKPHRNTSPVMHGD
jgi:hypothetical protein